MSFDIEQVHHVGHVVRDMAEALELYRRLGFRAEPPVYPLLSPSAGAPLQPFGVANTHVTFARDFVELATVVGEATQLASGARGVPLQAPPEQLPRLTEAIRRTSARVGASLARFEGLHILALQTADADASAARLAGLGIANDGVHAVKRPIETAGGPQVEVIRYVELEQAPEGRLALVEKSSTAREAPEHPNGAIGVVEAVLCVAATERSDIERRYESYLGRRPRREAAASVFELDGSAVTIVDEGGLASVLPGERAPAIPAFVGYAVAVRDLATTRTVLQRGGLRVVELGPHGCFVPASAALGTAVIFRQHAHA